MKKKVITEKNKVYWSINDYNTVEEVVESLNGLLSQAKGKLIIEQEWDYPLLSEDREFVTVVYDVVEREETDQEYDKRIKKEQAERGRKAKVKRDKEERERKEYERLAKKYGKQ